MPHDYEQSARDEAKDFIREFTDQITDMVIADEVSTDLFNDFPGGDSFIHETYTDRAYSLSEAAAVLDQLSEHEETDAGLWEDLDPRDAVATQAAYTYSAAAVQFIIDLLGEIGDALDAEYPSQPPTTEQAAALVAGVL